MHKPATPSRPSTPAGTGATTTAANSPEAARKARRRELMAEQSAKMGVRFVPAQVMRSIYEREGLL